jgi:SAM-dependent methyltransferase
LGQGIRRGLTAALKIAGRRKIRLPAGKPQTLENPSQADTSALPYEEFAAKNLAGIEAWLAGKSPTDALRLLFTLDHRLYALQGAQAVAYDNGVHTKHRHTRYHDFFVKRLRPGERVLDIGCGIGALAYNMGQAGAYVTGIDLSEANIRTAHERFASPRVTYICGDALVSLPVEKYETIVLSNVLEHLSDRASFLRKAQTKLRPLRWLIRVPLFERDWRVPLKKELGVEWRLDSTHEIEYTLESFADEMAASSLEPVHQETRWSEIWCEAHPK